MYNLHLLGWRDFQNLCHTILREILGQTVERFLDSKDGGRDGGFVGIWKLIGTEDLSGRYVVQCKHTSKANSSLSVNLLKDELKKAKRLVEAGHCDSYILMTNYGISGVVDERIKDELRKIGVKHSRNFGNDWLVQQITESSRLRMLVPRVYGLGDLSQILDERAYEQAKVLLESMHDDMSKVVVTAAYEKAVRATEKHGFVLLVGDPGCGKSTIASLLAMTAGDRWRSSVIKAVNAEEFKAHWNPHDNNQLFWIDDAFGTTQYEPALAQSWNRHFPEAHTAIKRGSKILMTSRNYIYKAARSDLKRSAFPLLEESQVVVNVHELTTSEREQILYNHLKLGHQSKSFKAAVKPYLSEVATRPNFLPETVRRFADPMFTKRLTFDRSAILRFFDNPREWLAEVISTLDPDARAAVALIHGGGGRLPNPIPDSEEVNQSLKRFGSSLGGASKAMRAMHDSLVRLTTTDKGQVWTFQHPSMEDAFTQILGESPDLLDIYLDTASQSDIATRVNCGGANNKNAVQVPPFLYPVVVKRLGRKPAKPAGSRLILEEQIEYFLARRTSSDFLRLFCESAGWILESLAHVSALFEASQLELAARLNSVGLLPEDLRVALSERLIEAIIDCEDPEVLGRAAVKQILKPEELKSLRERLVKDVMPSLPQKWNDWRDSISADDEYVANAFIEYLDALDKELADLAGTSSATRRQREIVDAWLERKEQENEETEAERPYATHLESPDLSRSTFDDLDE
jgi:energy-coupling factor transporter ATP-binding protein EcfA2